MPNDPLTLELEFTDEMMDNNRAFGQEIRKISKFLSAVAARYILAEKCDIHHPLMTGMLNSAVTLRQGADMADPPVVLNPAAAMGMPPRRAN